MQTTRLIRRVFVVRAAGPMTLKRCEFENIAIQIVDNAKFKRQSQARLCVLAPERFEIEHFFECTLGTKYIFFVL